MKGFEKKILIFFSLFSAFTLLNIYVHMDRCYHEKTENTKFFTSNTKNDNLPIIYFVTPTYYRLVQQAELTRLSHTLLMVENLHWILVEDSELPTVFVRKFLKKVFSQRLFNFNFTHLNVGTPTNFKMKENDPTWLKPKGVWQRNEALKWLRKNKNSIGSQSGVVYFGDDDNTYDLRLFSEIRSTKHVSVFPVGLVGGLAVEKPLFTNSKITGFNSKWKPNRKYPIDMSAFAISLKSVLAKQNAYFSPNVSRGYQETYILNQFIKSIDELEPKADMCQTILVWHTRTAKPKLKF